MTKTRQWRTPRKPPTKERTSGVWQTDAPNGYIGVVLYDRTDRLVMRIEVVEEEFSEDMVPAWQDWLRRHERIHMLNGEGRGDA